MDLEIQMHFHLDLFFSEAEKIKLLEKTFIIKTEKIKEPVHQMRGPRPDPPLFTYIEYKVVYEGSKFIGKLDDVFKERTLEVVKRLIKNNY